MSKSYTKKRAITLLDVARDAGVSRATASLVVRNSDLVADKTRKKVKESIHRLGYVYNRAAANLRANQTRTIGLVVTDITNPFFAELAIALQDELEEADYTVILTHSSDDLSRQDRILNVLRGHQVDGLIVCPARGSKKGMLTRLGKWGIPCVFVARYLQDQQIAYAGADNKKGAQMAVDYLKSLGHRHIAFVGGMSESSARRDRHSGFLTAMGANGQQVPCPETQITRQAGFDAITTLLDQDKGLTAAVCYNDVIAFGVMLGLQARGLTPGHDFSVIGFDDISEAALCKPSLTTIAIRPSEIGHEAVSLLFENMKEHQKKAPNKRILLPELVRRESCGPAN